MLNLSLNDLKLVAKSRGIKGCKSVELHSTQKIKDIEESILKLEEHLSNFKKHCFQDGFKYRNKGDIRNTLNWIAFSGVALNGIITNQ